MSARKRESEKDAFEAHVRKVYAEPKLWERARKHLDGLSSDASFRPPEQIMAEFAIAYAAPLMAALKSLTTLNAEHEEGGTRYSGEWPMAREVLATYEADAQEKP